MNIRIKKRKDSFERYLSGMLWGIGSEGEGKKEMNYSFYFFDFVFLKYKKIKEGKRKSIGRGERFWR